MKHFPVYLSLTGRGVVVTGGGEAALAKLRLLLKTEARLRVFARNVRPEIALLADQGRLSLHRREVEASDLDRAALVYAATEDAVDDERTKRLAQAARVPFNRVDDLEASDFITPAIVDRDPVTVAIGTEGTAPVLARAIKADIEARLPRSTGILARAAAAFRAAAEALPHGRPRRAFWSDWFFRDGPRAFDGGGEHALPPAIEALFQRHQSRRPEAGRVTFVGAGPGDPELLTLKARRALHEADVVIHDRLVTQAILELARREAEIVEMGKTGFGPSAPQSEIDDLIVAHALAGRHVVRLKSGDPGIFGRLDEELSACEAARIDFEIVPGVTSASAAAAAIGQSLTRRGRNSSVRLVTGHDMKGYAEQDWRALARPGEVAAIYMGKRAARFVQGRLLMHGAPPATPVSVVSDASRPSQAVLSTTLAAMAADMAAATGDAPALILFGLAPREAVRTAREIAL